MSHNYKITTNQRIDISDLVDDLRKKRISAYAIDRSPTYQIFEDGYSTRGVEITEEDDGYELRMTVLANSNDYLLCNQIAFFLCNNLSGTLTDEDGNEKFIGTLFYDLDISNKINSDIETTFALLREGHNIDIFGPIREFSFGERTRKKALSLQGDKHAIAYKLSKMILASQYPPENFIPFSNLLKITNDEGEEYYVQVITNSKDMVIEKVKGYAITSDTEEKLFLTPEQLISILPEEWELLDDYIILAKQLEEEKWKKFINDAKAIS